MSNEEASTGEGLSDGKPLGKHVAKATLWTTGNMIAGQVIRLASNLVLSRLLFPEAFGLMALTNAILQGLEMFSDLGVGPSVIQAKNPHPRLLDVAWSVHVVRGLGLWLISILCAYPAALWYNDTRLFLLIPAVGLVSAIRGFCSPTQFTLSRDLRLRELTIIEIGSQLIFVVATSVIAYFWRNVWALVFGGWLSAISFTIFSFFITKAPLPRWCWDREALRSITRFGRWVLISTIFTYLLNQGDRLILGSFLTLAQLGMYQIANVIARAVSQLNNVVASRVLFPVYAKVGSETTPLFVRRIAKVRLATMAMLLPPSWVLTCYGDFVVRWMWDTRYQGAGWMVRILAAGGIFLSFSAGPLYLARGEPWVGLLFGIVQACILVPAMIIGGHYWGDSGLIVALSFSQVADYILEIWVQRRYKVWLPWLDLLGLGSSIAVIAGGLALRKWLGF
jgi:O-antigen/teichoic acid export membrane protein